MNRGRVYAVSEALFSSMACDQVFAPYHVVAIIEQIIKHHIIMYSSAVCCQLLRRDPTSGNISFFSSLYCRCLLLTLLVGRSSCHIYMIYIYMFTCMMCMDDRTNAKGGVGSLGRRFQISARTTPASSFYSIRQ